ncbi:unnamed protein product [Effrenium voratum]|nr:unnamed protein product [Effrenium voratum]
MARALWLGCGCLLWRAGEGRALPAKNELANACYFTYRIGYVICDTSLGPEEAQREMEAGRCNEDFRVMGSDFQRLILQHYEGDGRPPLEEAMWLLTSPDHFQHRTLDECPPMQILANLLYGEALLHMDGASKLGESAQLAAQAMQHTRQVQPEVLQALSATWPLDVAARRFQETYLAAQSAAAARDSDFRIEAVICRCHEDLGWWMEVLANVPSKLFIYEMCSEGHEALEEVGLCKVTRIGRPAAKEVQPARSKIILRHLLDYGLDSSFVLVLPPAPSEAERQLQSLVWKSLASRTLEVEFLALGISRPAPKPKSPCQRSILQHFQVQGNVLGYEEPYFVVSSKRLRGSAARLRFLEEIESSGSCGLDQAMSGMWHVAFGERGLLPSRGEDQQVPSFLRALDGPSGFWRTRMPKSSDAWRGVSWLGPLGASIFRLQPARDRLIQCFAMAWWPEGENGEYHWLPGTVVALLTLVFFLVGQVFTTRVSIDVLEHCNPEGLKESSKNVWTNVGVTSALVLTMVMAMLQLDPIDPRGFSLEAYEIVHLHQWYGSFCIASLLCNLLCIMSCVINLSYVDPLSDVDAIKYFLRRIDSVGDPVMFMVESFVFFLAAICVWVLGTFGLVMGIMSLLSLIIFVYAVGTLWQKNALFSPDTNMEWTQDPELWQREDIMLGLKRRKNDPGVVHFVKRFGQVVMKSEREEDGKDGKDA